MSRKRRSRTSLQTAAIAAVCVLFVCVPLVGLYRCISQPLTLPDEGTVGPAADQGGDPSAPAEDGGVVFKFRLLELWGELMEYLGLD